MILEETLSHFDLLIINYKATSFDDSRNTCELMKDLAVILCQMELHRDLAYKKWTGVVFNSSEGSNAANERIADQKVPELYLLRHIMKGGYTTLDVMRSQISYLKKES